jgi:hypothetical protein
MNRFLLYPFIDNNGNNALLVIIIILIARDFINYFCFSCMSSGTGLQSSVISFLLVLVFESIVQIPYNSTFDFLQFGSYSDCQYLAVWLPILFMNSVFRVGSSIIYFRYNCSFFEEFKSKLSDYFYYFFVLSYDYNLFNKMEFFHYIIY